MRGKKNARGGHEPQTEAVSPLTEQRRRLILERVRAWGEVRTSELAGLFGVLPMTIRNDLNALSEAGALVRPHGGAVSNEPIAREPSYKDKETQHSAEKARIGRAAAAELEEGAVVFIGNGTTTMQLVRHLPRHERLVVFTNALNHAGALLEHPGVSVHVVGATCAASPTAWWAPWRTGRSRAPSSTPPSWG